MKSVMNGFPFSFSLPPRRFGNVYSRAIPGTRAVYCNWYGYSTVPRLCVRCANKRSSCAHTREPGKISNAIKKNMSKKRVEDGVRNRNSVALVYSFSEFEESLRSFNLCENLAHRLLYVLTIQMFRSPP